MKYAIIIEPSENGYSAYAPDVPGCVAAGDTQEETVRLMREALDFHLDGLRQDGEVMPPVQSTVDYYEVAA